METTLCVLGCHFLLIGTANNRLNRTDDPLGGSSVMGDVLDKVNLLILEF